VLSKIWKVLNERFTLLLVGFALTTVVGGLLTSHIQNETWKRQTELERQRRDYEWERQKRFELLRVRIDEGLKALESISDTANRRLYRLERVFDAIKRGLLTTEIWNEYMQSVDNWNVKLKYFEEELRRLVGQEFADELNNYETDSPERPPHLTSIHGKFYYAHKGIIELRDRQGGPETAGVTKDVAKLINELNLQTDSFVAHAGDIFLQRTAELEEFKIDDR
jgi:hypothetical protein